MKYTILVIFIALLVGAGFGALWAHHIDETELQYHIETEHSELPDRVNENDTVLILPKYTGLRIELTRLPSPTKEGEFDTVVDIEYIKPWAK